jgi:hypothetical protein
MQGLKVEKEDQLLTGKPLHFLLTGKITESGSVLTESVHMDWSGSMERQ